MASFYFGSVGSHSANLASAVPSVKPHGKDGEQQRAKEGKTQGTNSYPVSAPEATYFLRTKNSYGEKKIVYLSNLKKKKKCLQNDCSLPS